MYRHSYRLLPKAECLHPHVTASVGNVNLCQVPKDRVADGAYRRYYMHRTSHWLGLDVHDVGAYAGDDGRPRPLEPGMVITIEPGLYIAATDEQAPAELRGIGVRIEDDVACTTGTPENFTRDAFAKLA